MADDFQRLAVLIEANTKSYEKAMTRLQQQTERAIRSSRRSVEGLDATMAKLGGRVTRLAGLFGVAFSASYLVSFVTKAAQAGEAIGDTADKIGITAERLQELSYAAEQNGTSQDSLVTAFRGMSNILGEVERGSKTAAGEFRNIGINVSDLKGMSPDEVFVLLLDKIGKLEDPLKRNAALIKFFGRSGLEMAQLATLGAKGIDTFTQRARELGVVVSEENIQKSRDAADAISDISTAAQAAGTNMAAEFLPAITAIRDIVTSQGFQTGLAETARNVGKFVEFVAKLDPRVLQILIGGGVGYAAGGPLGAATGATFMAGKALGDTVIDAAAVAAGVKAGPKGDLLVSPRAGTPFDEGFTPSMPSMPGLAAAVAKKNGVKPAGGAGFGLDVEAQQKKYEELAASITEATAQVGLYGREQAVMADVVKLGTDATDKQRQSIARLSGDLYDAQQRYEQLTEASNFFAETMFNTLTGVLNRTVTLQEALADVLRTLAEALLKSALLGQGPFGSTFSIGGGPTGALGAIGTGIAHMLGFAGGGTYAGGKPILVGERGPEILTPRGSGSITPRGAMGQMGNGGIQLEVVLSDDLTAKVQQVSGPVALAVSQRVVGDYHRGRVRSGVTGAARTGVVRG